MKLRETVRPPRVAVLAAGSASGESGGAERLFQGVTSALRARGIDAEIIVVPSIERSFETIQASYLRFWDLDLSAFDGVISSKAPSYAVRHPNHVCYLMHTIRVFYDMFDHEFPDASAYAHEQRRFIQKLDTAMLADARLRKRMCIGKEVADRLWEFNGLAAEVMNCPSTLSGLHEGPFEHLFLPGRLHRWKRVDLAIKAFRLTDIPRPLVISGTGEDEGYFRQLAEGDSRIRFVGHLTEAEIADHYASSLGVIFVPRREDLGLVTFEAFLSGKPVLTVADSGEPANIVRDGVSGFVCPPTPEALAEKIVALHADPVSAAAMGATGRESIAKNTWENVARRLAAALGYDEKMGTIDE
ncbi:glycosyltransferase family 4 protein [Tropicimonas sp. IMCC6043]|uniref:glycosyltransferase family 4 protein n=1 Tax=Tropicimonas sp. IMCC6043 TaxID=2510645 RepID=UPI00101C4C23|nr:glycosyltransferase family 4 protein [Tropicimonas sp. IMCC6043]RYH06685.1 glycosyltransferase [Tropicimonas sp. IMCC6043]